MKMIPLYYASYDTEEEANKQASHIIGGGIVQFQDGQWHVFGIQYL